MGRAPLQFTAKIPFYNGLQLGPHEATVKSPLYPDAFRDFLSVASERDTGDMIHPELGRIKCKLESAECTWDGTKRGGVDVDVVWIESTDTASELDQALAQPSPAQQVADAATAADAEMAAALEKLRTSNADTDKQVRDLLEQFKDRDLKSVSFSELARRATAVTDQVDLFNRRVAGAIDSLTFRAQSLQASLERISVRPKYWPITQAATRMQSAGADYRNLLGSQNRDIGLYPVRHDTTLATVAQDIPAKLGDVMALNPRLATSPIVEAGTTVRFLLNAA